MAKGKKWTEEEIEFLKLIYPITPKNEIDLYFDGRSEKAISSKARLLGLKKKVGFGGKMEWTPELDAYLKEAYPAGVSMAEMRKRTGATKPAIYQRTKKLGVCRDPKWLLEQNRRLGKTLLVTGKSHRFEKGHKPWNTGVKGSSGLHPNSRKTQFKKGHDPQTTLHDGAITRRQDSKGNVYYYIRLARAKWIPYHRHLWIEENGPVPERHVIVFKDGFSSENLDDYKAENLECISLAENMRRNSYHNNYPPEIRRAIHATGVLNRMINKRKKEENA
jgi:hypothetical protein